ncbi:MAG: glucosaminidase domain-containing protein [Saccharospirillaceae bacterium]|nr:glucosaminidase domain-containing protein [Pseudomonadales bacterium]NRB79238.1 glucosaminidase domain-containing protein [Saccharospirillaceae bacterium]
MKFLPQFFITLLIFSTLGCSQSDNKKPVKIESTDVNTAIKAVTLPTATPNFAEFKDVKQKKKAFFDYIFAYVVLANIDIKAERDFIQSIDFSDTSLNAKDKKQLTSICKKYSNSCANVFRDDLKEELLNEVNFIPAALALAQSANESSWGTSRFSTQGNNYFGQWCYQKGCGLVPNSRNTGANHEVRSFDSALQSVQAYMFNINTHNAYSELREIREGLSPVELDGNKLAMGLIRYSERGEEYIKEIKSMIRINDLTSYDKQLAVLLK